MTIELFKRLMTEEEGAAAVEYAILVAVISGAVFAAVQLFNLNGIFTSVSNAVQAIITSATSPAPAPAPGP